MRVVRWIGRSRPTFVPLISIHESVSVPRHRAASEGHTPPKGPGSLVFRREGWVMVVFRVAPQFLWSVPNGTPRPQRRAAPQPSLRVEALEGRQLLATFPVTSLQATG